LLYFSRAIVFSGEARVSLYDHSIPTYQQILGGMQGVLDKAIAHYTSNKLEEVSLLHDRLYPDMFTFARQVQSFTDHAWRSSMLLAGKDGAPPARDETTLAGLRERIAKTIATVNSVSKADVDAHANKDVTFPMGPRQVTMKGADYMMHFAFPNFYFHATTAYNILRHRGVVIGKRDFLGVVPGMPKA
jgi:uncharacterized protein